MAKQYEMTPNKSADDVDTIEDLILTPTLPDEHMIFATAAFAVSIGCVMAFFTAFQIFVAFDFKFWNLDTAPDTKDPTKDVTLFLIPLNTVRMAAFKA